MWYQIRLKSQTNASRVFHIADETTYDAVGSGPGVLCVCWMGGGGDLVIRQPNEAKTMRRVSSVL